jgi:hypothetical protein
LRCEYYVYLPHDPAHALNIHSAVWRSVKKLSPNKWLRADESCGKIGAIAKWRVLTVWHELEVFHVRV